MTTNKTTLTNLPKDDVAKLQYVSEEHRKLSYAVEQSPCSIVITDIYGNIEYVNPKFTEVTGYTSEEVLGKNPRILKSGDTSSEEYVQLWKDISAGKVWRGEFHNCRKNGEDYWENASISAIRNEQGHITHYIAIKEDITIQKELESQLLKNERDRVLIETAVATAHEIYQPLTIIIGMAQLLKHLLPSESPYHAQLSSILKAGQQVKNIVDQMNHMRHYTSCTYVGTEKMIDFRNSIQQ